MVKCTKESQVRLILENDCILRQPIDSAHITCSGIYETFPNIHNLHAFCRENVIPTSYDN